MSAETTCIACGTDFMPDSGESIMHQIAESPCLAIVNRCVQGDGPLQRARAIYRERAGANEPQAQGTEEHEGGMPAVQTPEEAGYEAERAAEVRDQQAGGERQRSVTAPARDTDPPRHLSIQVTHCSRCPFHHFLEQGFVIPDRANVPAGHYCNHPENVETNNNVLATDQMIKDTHGAYSFRTWLDIHERADFPHTCPLKEPEVVGEPTGHRALDLG